MESGIFSNFIIEINEMLEGKGFWPGLFI